VVTARGPGTAELWAIAGGGVKARVEVTVLAPTVAFITNPIEVFLDKTTPQVTKTLVLDTDYTIYPTGASIAGAVWEITDGGAYAECRSPGTVTGVSDGGEGDTQTVYLTVTPVGGTPSQPVPVTVRYDETPEETINREDFDTRNATEITSITSWDDLAAIGPGKYVVDLSGAPISGNPQLALQTGVKVSLRGVGTTLIPGAGNDAAKPLFILNGGSKLILRDSWIIANNTWVVLVKNGGEFVMRDGTIGNGGGGVKVESGGIFTKTGGTIYASPERED
jgi:hypothetical protein